MDCLLRLGLYIAKKTNTIISYSVNGQFNETAKYGLYLLFSDYIATCWWRDCLSAGKPEFFWKKFAGF